MIRSPDLQITRFIYPFPHFPNVSSGSLRNPCPPPLSVSVSNSWPRAGILLWVSPRARDGIAGTSPWSAERIALPWSSFPLPHGSAGRPLPTADAGRGNTGMAAGARRIVAVQAGNLVIARVYLVRKGDGLIRRIALMDADARHLQRSESTRQGDS